MKHPEPAISRFELNLLAPILRSVEPRRTYLEIGARFGGSLTWFAGLMEPESTLVSVDMPGGPWGREGSEQSLKQAAWHLRNQGHLVQVILGDSHDMQTLKRVETALGGRPADVLLIDGDHTSQGVEQDIRDYTPLVRPGGVVVFHDCGYTLAAGCRREPGRSDYAMHGVHEVFKRFAEGRRSLIVQESWGTGLVWM